MPRVSTIAEVIAMDNDDIIKIVRGTIKKRFERKSGKNDKGDWSFENLKLSDGKDEIDVSLKGREPLPSIFKVGSRIVISAHQGEKGWTGVKAVDEEVNGSTIRKIRVTPTGDVELENSGSAPAEDDGGDESPAPQSKTSAPAPKPAPTQKPASQRVGPKLMISQISSLYLYAHRASKLLKNAIESDDKRIMDIEEFTAMRASIFIQACYEKGYWDVDPIHILLKKEAAPPPPKPVKPPPPPEPEPPAQNYQPAEPENNVPF